MAQGRSKPSAAAKSKHEKSKGAKRKQVGKQAGKSKGTTLPANKLRDEASRFYTRSVEADLASRLPSDQRDKLTVLRNAPGMKPVLQGMKKKHMTKPLVRGRKRKATKRLKGEK